VEFIKEIKKVNPEDGDLLIIKVTNHTPAKTVRILKETMEDLKQRLGKEFLVLIMSKDVEISSVSERDFVKELRKLGWVRVDEGSKIRELVFSLLDC